MAKQVFITQDSHTAGELYDTVREECKRLGREKAFIEEFGTKKEYLAKCHIKEAKR